MKNDIILLEYFARGETMERRDTGWHSERLGKGMGIRVYGHGGRPVLVFPTQDSMCDNFENFGMIDTLAEPIENGRIQLFCVDTVDSESWSNVWGDKGWRAARQETYYDYIIEEVLPFIRSESGGALPIVTGCSMGATHSVIVFFRRPELFSGVLAMSGVYDARYFFDGWMNETLYWNSPVDFLAGLPQDHPYVDLYNQKKMVLCIGQGQWEDEGRVTTARLRDIFNEKGIHAWVDFWGYDVDHDWPWWKKQIVYFLPYLMGER